MAVNGFVGCLVSQKNRTVSYIRLVSDLAFFAFYNFFLTAQLIGINGESTFEAEILESTRHCQIWGYDFSVSSFGPQILPNQSSRTHFFAYGLGGGDQHGPDDSPKMYTLDTLMRLNGSC
jgi:hypothetical protein